MFIGFDNLLIFNLCFVLIDAYAVITRIIALLCAYSGR